MKKLLYILIWSLALSGLFALMVTLYETATVTASSDVKEIVVEIINIIF